MNKEVTATGMIVQAKGEGGIIVGRLGYDRDNNATNTLEDHLHMDADQLYPTSTADATNWYHASAASASDELADYTTMRELTLTDSAPTESAAGFLYDATDSNKKYVLYDTYTVYPDKNAASFTDLWLSSCSVSSSSQDLSTSLRVAVVCGEGQSKNTVICAPVAGATSKYRVNGNSSTEGGIEFEPLMTSNSAKFTTLNETGNNKNVLYKGTVNTTGMPVKVYVFFEGEDGNHFTKNLIDPKDSLTVTVTFMCTDVTAS